MPVHQQHGGADCGLFAGAFAVDLAYGNSPESLVYNQRVMRAHLTKCFANGKITPFPRSAVEIEQAPVTESSLAVFCECRMSEFYDENMVECTECKKWFHYACVGLKARPTYCRELGLSPMF